MGFQHMKDVYHKAASRKGGKIKIKKGFGANPELARLAGAKGGKAKHENRSRADYSPKKADTGHDNGPRLADVLDTIEEFYGK